MPVWIAPVITGLLEIPPVRSFLEEVVIRVMSEVLFPIQRDPAFKKSFLDLMSQLSAETTEEGKKKILQQINALRGTKNA